MYTPKHLEWLDRVDHDAYGWPVFITDEARAYCKRMLVRGFHKYTRMDLELARKCIFEDFVREPGESRPECLKLGLYDAQYGVTHRALLEVGAVNFWVSSNYA